MMKNRILRFFEQPTNVFHGSVFHQFSGGVGPSSLTIDKKTNQIYVAHYDTIGSFFIVKIFVIFIDINFFRPE
jgi:aspartate beta-hydroxylase